MFCPKCGVSNEDGVKNCVSCGSPMPEAASGTATAKSPLSGVSVNQLGGQLRPMERIGFFTIAGSALLMIIGVFLPFFGVEVFGTSATVNYLGGGSNEFGDSTGDGVILLIFGIILLVLVALHLFKFRLTGPCLTVAGLTGLLGVILPLGASGSLKSDLGGYSMEDFGIYRGVGFWFVLLAAIGLLVGVFLVIRDMMKKPIA